MFRGGVVSLCLCGAFWVFQGILRSFGAFQSVLGRLRALGQCFSTAFWSISGALGTFPFFWVDISGHLGNVLGWYLGIFRSDLGWRFGVFGLIQSIAVAF